MIFFPKKSCLPECPTIRSPLETLAWHAIDGDDGVMKWWHTHTVDIGFKASLWSPILGLISNTYCLTTSVQPYIRYLLYQTENAKKKFSTKILKAKHGRSRSYTNHRAPCRFAPHAERKRERWRIAIIRSYLQDGPAGFYTINWCTGIVKKVDPRFREHTLATIEVAKLGDHATKGLPFLPSMSMTYTMLERFLIENIVRPLKYLYKHSIIFSCLILVDQTVYANTTEY